jgi:hypothetical protein
MPSSSNTKDSEFMHINAFINQARQTISAHLKFCNVIMHGDKKRTKNKNFQSQAEQTGIIHDALVLPLPGGSLVVLLYYTCHSEGATSLRLPHILLIIVAMVPRLFMRSDLVPPSLLV